MAVLNPDDFASVADYVAAVKALTDAPAHPDDVSKADEHAALFALVPRNEATNIAVKSGSWFDPATWADGRIPAQGAKVLIPEAITVNYDGVSDTSLFTVRVDGKLQFATNQNTRMVVDTLVVAPTGLLQIGTKDNPVQDGVTADILIANDGPIDVNWDPLLLSRGIISHGTTDIHGQEKTSFLKLALDPVAGSTMLFFNDDAAKNGWKVGDKIVVTGTHIAPQQESNGDWVNIGTQDETRTIKAIYGSTVVLDSPLEFNHDTPSADLKAYVADYTRNVVIETQNADNVPVSERGHIMFMHNPLVDVEYAELSGLGRTDKSVRAVDAETTSGITSDTNVKGRYALHLHETGVDPGSQQAIIKGNAVWGSPGWGIVQHDSNADIENNATFDTFGAGFVAETGNETGIWHDNIAIGAHGVGAGAAWDKDANDVAAFDLARTGIGFFFEGRMIKATNNVAADVNQGFVYMDRGSAAMIPAGDLAQPDISHGLASTDISVPPIQNFTDNEVLAANDGLTVIKAGPYQDHDVRSVIDGFKAWEVYSGIHLEYTAHYTFLNTELVGPQTTPDLKFLSSDGVELGNNTFDIVFNKSSISNFQDGIILGKQLTGDLSQTMSPTDFNYVFIDLNTQNIANSAIRNFDPNFDRLVSSANLSSGPATLQMSWTQIPVWSFDQAARNVPLDGTKTDSLGTLKYALDGEPYDIGLNQMAGLLSNQGYYTTDDGRKIVIVEEDYADRATGEIFKTGIPIQLADDVPLVQTQWFGLGHNSDAISLGRIDLNALAPIANGETVSTSQGASVLINVLANDLDPNGYKLFVDGVTQPAHGTVKDNLDGTLTYRPDQDFTGTETFKYWITDHNGKFTGATVTLNVGSGTGPSPSGPTVAPPVLQGPTIPVVTVPSPPTASSQPDPTVAPPILQAPSTPVVTAPPSATESSQPDPTAASPVLQAPSTPVVTSPTHVGISSNPGSQTPPATIPINQPTFDTSAGRTTATFGPLASHRGVANRPSFLDSFFESSSIMTPVRDGETISRDAAKDSVIALLNQYAAAGFRGRSEASEMISHASNLPSPNEPIMISLPHHSGRTDH
jgi:hypothetical protein